IAGALLATQVNLTSTGGSIGNVGSTFFVSVAGISAQATSGTVNITDQASGSVTIGASNANSVVYSIPNATALATNGDIVANAVTITAPNASITFGGNVTGQNGGTVSVTGGSNINDGTFTITAGQLSVQSNSTSIGTNSPLNISAQNVSLKA